MKYSIPPLVVLLTTVVAITWLAGCSDNEPTGPTGFGDAEDAAAALVPGDSEVAAELGLSPEQMAAMGPALDDWRNSERSAFRDQHGGDRFDFRAGHRERMMNFLTRCANVLDTEQFVALVQMLAERMENMREHAREFFGDGTHPRHHGRFGPGGHRQFQGHFGDILEDLDLTEAQKQLIQAYLTERRENRPQERPSDPEERRAWRQQMHQEWRDFLETVLTEDQLTLLEELREARHQEMLERRQVRMVERSEHLITFLTTVLHLDAEQTAQIEELAGDALTAAQAARDSHAAGDLTREEFRSARQEIRDNLVEGIRALLDEDQLARFEALLVLLPPRWI